MARIRLVGVRKVYEEGRGHVAIPGADLEIADGEFMVLVGPSGSGKSTLLRMIAGLESVTAGELWIGDRLVNELPPGERDVAMVFQSYALYPHMSVFENMAFGLRLRRLPEAEIQRRVREAARTLGLEALLERRPRQLSGGQRQRVALGRAIVRQPQAFLFDEPLSNLDAALRVQMRREIARLHRRLGATMVYVTHDQVEAMTMGDRIAVLRDGRVQQVDAPLALYARPANRFVGGFIGSPAMNFLEGRFEGAEALRFVGAGGVAVALPPSRAAALAAHAARPVTLGVRPEHVAPADGADRPAAATFRLDLVEPLGSEVLLHASADGAEVTARIPPRALPEPGAPIALAFDADALHFFDAETGERLGD